jgi:large subunit ribosomal protein L10e
MCRPCQHVSRAIHFECIPDTHPSGQVILSIRCRDSNKPVIMEALRRARYKFPGRQKIIISKKWGFTSLDRADYETLKSEKKVINDGAYVQVGPIICAGNGADIGQFLKPKGKLMENLRTAARA